MAESDAAGPGSTGGPKARTLTREDLPRLLAEADREWQSLTPAERARRKAEAEKADREAYEAARRAALPTLEALERMAETASRAARMASGLDAAARLVISPDLPSEPADFSAGLGRHRPLDLSGFEFEPAARPSTEEIRAAVADGVRDAISSPQGRQTIARARREVKLADRLEADWASTTGRRFLVGETVRKIAAHYGVSHGTLQGCPFWREKILPVRQKAERGSKAAAWRDRLSRENH